MRSEKTYHLEELVHLTKDRKLFAKCEEVFVFGRMRSPRESIPLTFLREHGSTGLCMWFRGGTTSPWLS